MYTWTIIIQSNLIQNEICNQTSFSFRFLVIKRNCHLVSFSLRTWIKIDQNWTIRHRHRHPKKSQNQKKAKEMSLYSGSCSHHHSHVYLVWKSNYIILSRSTMKKIIGSLPSNEYPHMRSYSSFMESTKRKEKGTKSGVQEEILTKTMVLIKTQCPPKIGKGFIGCFSPTKIEWLLEPLNELLLCSHPHH